ncbi:MAG: undecaprenyl/decaprenyl-phosphate alpha-N-acetylglucosaminyl 1-phosphate transferase [Candidatus Omnitrophica bacterium]|nr:undecaprenyl/decaprenyl-phosphate alpha-N-acetylglucosaminyl 1-phosphate transferase [Candidatus Omnitrophota bacterium]
MFILSLNIFLLSFLINLIITKQAIKIKYITRNGISQLGGVTIWFSFLLVSLSILIYERYQFLHFKEILGIFICSTLIFVIGLIDDKKELSVSIKFLTQLAITVIVMIFGVRTQIVGMGVFGNTVVTLLWILGVTNAFNHLDIVDGLSSGIAFISTLTFYIFSIITLNIPVALILIALAGSILGFFRYNFPSGRIYMGNSGSHFLGFLLSTLAITISYATLERRIALIIPLLVLGFPIFDTLFVIWVRLLKHKPVWSKSNDHLALKLISMGFPKKKVVIYMFLLAILFSASAVFILFLSNIMSFMVLLLLITMCIYIAFRVKGRINER